jgi:hypothetical protein
MQQKYYLSSSIRSVMVLALIILAFMSYIFVLASKYTSLDIPGGGIPFVILNLIGIGIIIWRIYTPVLEISTRGLKVNVPFIFKSNFARWDEIDGLVVGEMSTFGVKERNIRLLLKTEKATTKEILFSLKAVEKAEEIVTVLRGKIPEIKYEDIKQASVFHKPLTKTEMKYKGWTLTKSGLQRWRKIIRWDNIHNLQYQGFVIAGYGATTIHYSEKSGKERSIHIQPSTSTQYQDFIKFVIQHSQNASIDPGLLRALEYPPKDAMADIISILLFLFGTLLFFFALSFLNYYSPTVTLGYIYPLLVVPFVALPMIMAIKLIAGRFRGKAEKSSKKLLWSGLVSIGPILAMLTFFVLSLFSLYWFVGDIYNKTGDLEKAEVYYVKALNEYPESMDILYEMGKLYRQREQWETAFDYLKRAYESDPTYWGPRAVVLAPDTLMKMGKYNEALELCKEILKNHPNKIDIKRAITRKQDYIVKERQIHEM